MPLNNVTTANDYTAGTTLETDPPATKLNMVVANAAVYVNVSNAGGLRRSQAWDLETYYPPGYYNLNKPPFNAVRVRSAVAGTPAQVTISAL